MAEQNDDFDIQNEPINGQNSFDLDVDPTEYETTNLTNAPEFTNLIDRIGWYLMIGAEGKTHPLWALGLACGMVGMMAGRERKIKNEIGELSASFYCAYIGMSRLDFKTALLRKAKLVLEDTQNRINELKRFDVGISSEQYKQIEIIRHKRGVKTDVEKALLEKFGDFKEINYFIPISSSSEALLSHLDKPENKQGILFCDEFGKLAKETKAGNYMANAYENISLLYDGDLGEHETISRGKERGNDLHTCFVACTTPYVLQYMDEKFFYQGTGNRIWWITPPNKIKIPEVEYENFVKFWDTYQTEGTKIISEREKIIRKLMFINKLPEYQILLSMESASFLYKIHIDYYNKGVDIKEKKGIMDTEIGIWGGLAENIMKLSIVICIGRYAELEEIPDKLEIIIDDCVRANKMGLKYVDEFLKIKDLALGYAPTGGYHNIEKEKRKLLEIIDKFNGATLRQIRQFANWDSEYTQKVIDGLLLDRIILRIETPQKMYYTRNPEFVWDEDKKA